MSERLARLMLQSVCRSLATSAGLLDHQSSVLRALLEEEKAEAFSYGQNISINGLRGVLTITWEPSK